MGFLSRLRCNKGQQQGPDTAQRLGRQPRSLSRLLDGLVARGGAVQACLLTAGLLGLLLLPLLERRIEFDENALLAGSARPTISTSLPSALAAGVAFADSLEPAYFSPAFSSALQAALAHAGLEVSNHTLSVVSAAAAGASSAAAAGAAGDGGASGGDGGWTAGGGSGGGGGGGIITCVNVHAVVRSPRGDGKEALVLVTPINHQHVVTDFHQDASGARLALALGAALASHLRAGAAPWLAKELVWLLPDASCGLVASVEAWTATYQLAPLDQAGASPHFARAGVLQQALVLEAPVGAFTALQVSLEGWDGQLPKLDMFYLFRWYCHAFATAPVELAQLSTTHLTVPPLRAAHALLAPLLALLPPPAADVINEASLHDHLLKLQAVLQFMARQARGLPTGAHAAFKALGVDSATLRLLRRDETGGAIVGPAGFDGAGNAPPGGGGLPQPQPLQHQGYGPSASSSDDAGGSGSGHSHVASSAPTTSDLVGFEMALHQLANVLEASLRSCSVLIERFHHSLFLYVLTGLGGYVSVERYIGPLVALIGVIVMQAACIARAASAAAADDEEKQPHAPGKEQQSGAAAAAAAGRFDTLRMGSTPDDMHGSSDGHDRNDSGGGSSGLQAVLELHRLQVPACQADAAAQRAEWVEALRRVALLHAAALAAAALARAPPAAPAAAAAAAAGAGGAGGGDGLHGALHGLPLGAGLAEGLWQQGSWEQQHAGWLGQLAAAAAVAAPAARVVLLGLCGGLLVSPLVSAGGALLLLLPPGGAARRRCSTTSSSSSGGGGSSNPRQQQRGARVRAKVLAVELSAVSAVLAAVACINWALAYVACLVLVPLGLLMGSGQAAGASTGTLRRSSSSGVQHLLRASLLAALSPPGLLLALSAATPGVGLAGAGRSSWLAWLLRGSASSTYALAAGLYLPCWLLAVWAQLAGPAVSGPQLLPPQR